MWEIDNLSQLIGFLYSVAMGILFCFVYDLLRALRAEIKLGTAAVFAGDIIYSLFCAVSCFCFLLSVTGGEVRAFVLAGAAAGFILSRLTVSKAVFFVLTGAVRAAVWIFARISKVSRRFFAFAGARFKLLIKKAEKIYAFCENTLKKHLKKK